MNFGICPVAAAKRAAATAVWMSLFGIIWTPISVRLTLKNESHGRLAPCGCLPWFDFLGVEPSDDGTVAHALVPPFDHQGDYGHFAWVFDQHSINQAVPVRSISNAQGHRLTTFTCLTMGVGSQVYVLSEKGLTDSGLRAAKVIGNRA